MQTLFAQAKQVPFLNRGQTPVASEKNISDLTSRAITDKGWPWKASKNWHLGPKVYLPFCLFSLSILVLYLETAAQDCSSGLTLPLLGGALIQVQLCQTNSEIEKKMRCQQYVPSSSLDKGPHCLWTLPVSNAQRSLADKSIGQLTASLSPLILPRHICPSQGVMSAVFPTVEVFGTNICLESKSSATSLSWPKTHHSTCSPPNSATFWLNQELDWESVFCNKLSTSGDPHPDSPQVS